MWIEKYQAIGSRLIVNGVKEERTKSRITDYVLGVKRLGKGKEDTSVKGIVKLTLGALELDVGLLIQFLQHAISQKLENDTKKKIEEAVNELVKGLELIDNMIDPFYEVRPGPKFKEKFDTAYNCYLKYHQKIIQQDPSMFPMCHKIYDMIYALGKPSLRERIRKKIMGFDQEITEMNKIADNWLFNDGKVTDGMTKFDSDFLDRIHSIYYNLDTIPREKSEKKFSIFIEEIKQPYDSIKEKKKQLKNIITEI